MKVILNTTDGKQVSISEEETTTEEEPTPFQLPSTLAVLQTEELTIKVKSEELVRAVNAMWPTVTQELI